MGNLLASSGSNSARNINKTANLGAVPESLGGKTDAAAATKEEDKLENPGTLEDLHKKCKDVHAMTFEGAKIMLNKGLSNHFQVQHTINMCSTQPSGYRFGVTYVGAKQYGPNEAFPVLLGDIDPSGNLNANIIHQFSQRLRLKFASQIQDSTLVASQLTSEYRGSDYTASLTLGNPNIFSNSGVIICQYLQSISSHWVLGSEMAYQYGPNVPGRQIAAVSGVARYTDNDYIWSGSLGPSGFHLCYYLKASDQLQIGVEVETSLRMQESTATIGYQVDLPKADLIFRGSFDSNWHIVGMLEKRLHPLPFSFALCGRINHKKDNFRLGCGLMIG